MRRLLMLDIVEATLLNVEGPRSTARVRAGSILRQLQQYDPARYGGYQCSDIEAAIRAIYPIYKNRRRRTKRLKISEKTAIEFLDMNRLGLRPRQDAQDSLLGKAVRDVG